MTPQLISILRGGPHDGRQFAWVNCPRLIVESLSQVAAYEASSLVSPFATDAEGRIIFTLKSLTPRQP